MSDCSQCQTPGKYKCSQCPSMYCSIPCYKSHKEVCVSTNSTQTSSITTSGDGSANAMNDSFSPSSSNIQDKINIPPMFKNNPRICALFEHQIEQNKNNTNELNQKELFSILNNENLISNLHDHDLQHIIITINNAPSHNLKMLCLRHQIEFNPDFAAFVEALLIQVKTPDNNHNPSQINGLHTLVDQNLQNKQQAELAESLQSIFGTPGDI